MSQISSDARKMKNYLETYGWIKGTIGQRNGPACIVGSAISSGLLNEDDCTWYEYPIIEAIGEYLDIPPVAVTGWNDDLSRSEDEVLDMLENVAIKYDDDAMRSVGNE